MSGVPELDALLRADLTYAEVGLSLATLPAGYNHVERTAIVGRGSERLDEAAGRVMTWGMHRGAGLSVRPSSESVVEGAVAVLGLGWRSLSIKAPVRVMRVVDEPRRRGFAYGTLPGHPECGEESFVVELLDNDEVAMTIRSFSRAATVLARAGGPVNRAVQARITSRYLAAV